MRIITIVLLLGIATAFSILLYKQIDKDYQLYLQESECVAKKIQHTERINIKTENGDCSVHFNGYYQ